MKEVNFDGLVGPTHNYAGLSYGNVASIANAGSISNPRQAAKQGLQKMHLLMQLGVPQAVMPPHQRPNLHLLRTLGFNGGTAQMLQQAHKLQPSLLAAVYSAASMWTANMATVSPSADTHDGKVHFTSANLTYNLHRAQEAQFSYKLLQTIFADDKHFTVHEPLPAYRDLSDEGAANHSVLCKEYGEPGIELFVYGRHGLDDKTLTQKFPGRQTELASVALLHTHGIKSSVVMQQNPAAIDSGVFHNDVVFVANKNVIFAHNDAFDNWMKLRTDIASLFGDDFYYVLFNAQQINLATAVETYLFNSQLVSLSEKKMALIVPMECKDSPITYDLLNEVVAADNPIQQVHYVECRQSMRNGGGPACLRLRVILNPTEFAACKQDMFLTPELYKQLDQWIEQHYRDRLSVEDLLDPNLVSEVENALDQLTRILNLGSIYPFQQT